MEEKKVAEIVQKVFDKAKTKSVSHTKHALSNEVANVISEEYSYISPRTLERAFSKYLEKKKNISPPKAESINLYCRYLGYKDYKNYVEENSSGTGPKWKLILTIGIAFGAFVLILRGIRDDTPNRDKVKNETNRINTGIDDESGIKDKFCMTWADSLYVTVSCNMASPSTSGTEVIPLNFTFLESMRKVKVHAAYDFFTEDNKPRIWYYKSKDGEIEYYTYPGRHPVNGETLKKITPYIIEKYVDKHRYNAGSFLAPNNTNKN